MTLSEECREMRSETLAVSCANSKVGQGHEVRGCPPFWNTFTFQSIRSVFTPSLPLETGQKHRRKGAFVCNVFIRSCNA